MKPGIEWQFDGSRKKNRLDSRYYQADDTPYALLYTENGGDLDGWKKQLLTQYFDNGKYTSRLHAHIYDLMIIH